MMHGIDDIKSIPRYITSKEEFEKALQDGYFYYYIDTETDSHERLNLEKYLIHNSPEASTAMDTFASGWFALSSDMRLDLATD